MIEKVNPMHPDKIADRIAGAIVDLAYTKEENPKVAVEVLIGHGECNITIESNCEFDQSFNNLEIEAILATKRSSYKIGAQSGTTGYMYVRGDSGFGYKGFARIDVIAFTTAALAIRDLSNGKIDAVILDYQPALEIVKAINSNQ